MLNEIIKRLEQENLSISKAMRSIYKLEPHIAIVNTNLSDEPTQRYIKSKIKKCEEYGIKTSIHEPTNMEELLELISNLNNNKKVTSIIIQYPFADWITKSNQEIFDLVYPAKDIDRLNSCWYYDKKKENLPLTAEGIKDIIEELYFMKVIKENEKILFVGNGITTNRRLFLNMFDKGMFDCRIVNSKTPKQSVKELIHWSHMIISAIGQKNSLDVEGKIVICPSIIKNEDGTFSSDLIDEKIEKNITNNVLGTIGKLTVSKLICRAYKDIYNKRMKCKE